MPAKRPARTNPLLGVTDEIADIMGTRNPQGVRDSYPIKEIDVAAIQPNPEQPRKEFDEESLQGLAISIKNHGIVQPLVVTFRAGVVYCVAGERRLRAAKIAGLKTVPCIVREEVSNDDLVDLAVEENMHRQNLNPLEEAYALDSYMKRKGVSAERMAEMRGLSRKTVDNRLALIRYPEIATAVADGRLGASQATTITFTVDRPGQGALRTEILETLAAGEPLTPDQVAAATGTKPATLAAAPIAAPVPMDTTASTDLTPPATPSPAPTPPTSAPAGPATAMATASQDVAPSTAGSPPPSRSAAPPAQEPAAADRMPVSRETRHTAGPGPADQSRRLQDLQELYTWLSATDLTSWIDALPPEMLEGYLTILQGIQQQLPAAIETARTRQARQRPQHNDGAV